MAKKTKRRCVVGEVHTETPGLYEVKNWSNGPKIKKDGTGGKKVVKGGGGIEGVREWEGMRVVWKEVHRKMSLSTHKLEL